MSARARLRSRDACSQRCWSWSNDWKAALRQTPGRPASALMNCWRLALKSATDPSRLPACRFTASPVIENLVPSGCSFPGLAALVGGGEAGVVLGHGGRRRGRGLAKAAGLLLQPGHGVVPVVLEVAERRDEVPIRLGAVRAREHRSRRHRRGDLPEPLAEAVHGRNRGAEVGAGHPSSFRVLACDTGPGRRKVQAATWREPAMRRTRRVSRSLWRGSLVVPLTSAVHRVPGTGTSAWAAWAVAPPNSPRHSAGTVSVLRCSSPGPVGVSRSSTSPSSPTTSRASARSAGTGVESYQPRVRLP